MLSPSSGSKSKPRNQQMQAASQRRLSLSASLWTERLDHCRGTGEYVVVGRIAVGGSDGRGGWKLNYGTCFRSLSLVNRWQCCTITLLWASFFTKYFRVWISGNIPDFSEVICLLNMITNLRFPLKATSTSPITSLYTMGSHFALMAE
jgi:hypothetical protein